MIAPVDKVAGNYSFCCKRLYAHTLRTELGAQDGAYREVGHGQPAVEEIIQAHRRFLAPLSLWNKNNAHLPFVYSSLKLHKKPISFRFIASCGKCTTTSLSKLLSNVLNFLLDEIRKMDDEVIDDTGVRRLFVVKGYEEVMKFFSKWSAHQFQSVQTGDFSTMYTTIPHDDLKDIIAGVFETVWNYKKRVDPDVEDREKLFLKCSGREVEWKYVRVAGPGTTHHSSNMHVMSQKNVLDLLYWQIDNVYLANGDGLYRQVGGIPIGTNDGPGLANMFLYGYESRYINRLDEEEGEQFQLSFRLIDDTLSMDNLDAWSKAVSAPYHLGGMYPVELVYNDTSISNREANFLGVKIRIVRCGVLETNVYDKRREFKFRIQRYPHMLSFIPDKIPYGVFVGLLHRCYRICSTPYLFSENVRLLFQTFVTNGCHLPRLFRLLRVFLSARAPLRWKKVKWWKLHKRLKQTHGVHKVAGAPQEPD